MKTYDIKDTTFKIRHSTYLPSAAYPTARSRDDALEITRAAIVRVVSTFEKPIDLIGQHL